MSDIEEIRRKRLEQLQQQQASQQAAEAESYEKMREFEAQKKQIMIQILTPEARSRLANLRLTKKEFVDNVELQLIQLAQAGRIKAKITDEQLKQLLKQVTGSKREINIIRK
jgi:programmed cell death protein 5